MLAKADVVVAEVTQKSLGVGYELGRAEAIGKPILALYRGAKQDLSAMIAGNPYITLACYTEPTDIPGLLKTFLEHQS